MLQALFVALQRCFSGSLELLKLLFTLLHSFFFLILFSRSELDLNKFGSRVIFVE